ncbi:MAG: hypothetical protein K2H20_02090, partial [Bacilli bacterium]|nr:hypothetical protein [Bacilli bacterium]
YSNYSYQIEVEMMGNAQIQPLMYFQLLNIPMWRGAYMIYQVSHNMTPGNMTTRIKAMKMSKNPVPILSSYWTGKVNNYNSINVSEGSGSSLEYNSNGSIKGNSWDSIGAGYIGDLGASSQNMKGNLGTLRTNGKKCLDEKNWDDKYINTAHNNYMTDLPKMEFNLKGGKYNLNKAINIIYNLSHYNLKNCTPRDKEGQYVSIGWCSHYTFTAVGNGFGIEINTDDAWKEINMKTLNDLGFMQIYDGTGNLPSVAYAGDIVLQRYYKYNKKENKFKESGHATMFTGKHWVSDFIQKNGLDNAKGYLSPNENSQQGQGIYAVFRIPGIENYVKPYTHTTSSSYNTTSNKSIFEVNRNYDYNVFCQPEGKFEYNPDNIKKGVLYFVAHGEGGLRRQYGKNGDIINNKPSNPITDYCGIAKATDKNTNQNLSPKFFTNNVINTLN